ncbi:MAG: UDP-3-O-(3-hydroxymyristoyl)glucosamine N-acyltransferase [Synergistaceae bacterium]|nr:UDP-3-O-(3-hydroxymyristoyl)glucosamine N-acyltransferase [Synergistaceae bacterium]
MYENKKEMLLSEIGRLIGAELVGEDRKINGVAAPEPGKTAPDKLCVVWDLKELHHIPEDVPTLTVREANRQGLAAENPRFLLPALLSLFEDARPIRSGVHPSAVIGSDCEISGSAWIGPCCVIGNNVKIGELVQLEAGVYIDDGCVIGKGTVMESNVSVRRAKIGANVLLHSNCVIGCEGFGFLPGPSGIVKIPQIGGVVIGDNVEVGAGSAIDCGTIGDTEIGEGTRIDNHVQIGHNCKVGKNCIFCGKSGMGGSTVVGDNVIFAAEAATRDHVKIGSNSQIGGRGGVTHDIPSGVTVSGYPAQDHKKELKMQAHIARLPKLYERVRKLEKAEAEKE